ncbi:VMAP-related conflict system protein [Streptomyces sp. NPDC057690]|uniref:VMAP-related conflict system protein n=1 Tax=Streptomyces sp. NPDC057690 TaxID=3346214 RepID=UPI0036B99E23
MDTGSRQVLDLLGGFVVQVSGPGLRGGSGFFAGRGLVVTCAHVVALSPQRGSRATAVRARTAWRGGHAEGTVVALPPTHSGKGLWTPPDLAVITLDEPVPDHLWIPMAEQAPGLGQRLYAVGYSTVYEQTPRLGVSAVEYEGPQEFDGTGQVFLQLKNGELAPGKSGGPLLDLDRGEVCGVVTTTRRENLDMGGLALDVSTIRAEFPELWRANKAPNPVDTELWRLRAALQHEYAPGGVLSLREEETLLRSAQRCGLAPAALYWRSVHRDYGEPSGRLDNMADVLREVADAPAMLDGPPPLLMFIRQVADAAPPKDVGPLTRLIGLVADRLGVTAPPPAAGVAVVSDNRVAAISVHLDTQGPDGEHYLLRVWKYPDVTAPPYAVLCDDRPLTLAEAQEQFRAVVPPAVADLAEISSNILMEFALPAAKLSAVDVDSWYLSQEWAPVSRQYPVVLRVLDRKPETYPSWRARWQRLFHGSLDGAPATMDWVNCHSDVRPEQFYARLQQRPALSVLALPFSPDATARQHVLETALYAGVPVAVWTRAGCSAQCRLRLTPGRDRTATAASVEASGACAGLDFRDAVEAELGSSSISILPELIMKLRVDAATATSPGHCGEKVVLLWDDAIRKLPGDGPALRVPQHTAQGGKPS